jgi:iron complex transport system permease protein
MTATLAAGQSEGDRRARGARATWALLVLLGLAALAALGSGASGVSLGAVLRGIWSAEGLDARTQLVLFEIRLPRLVVGMLVGAALAVSGALMQGLFRNPLADPGLVGVGAGSGLGAVVAIVLGGLLPFQTPWLVPVAAFAGGWCATLILYRVATRQGRTSVAMLLLAGIALAALAGAITGILIYLADDNELRDLTFWSMGSLAGSNWDKAVLGLPFILPVLLFAPLLGGGLNALSLGEAAARHIGHPVERIKLLSVLGVAAAVGAATAIAGGIGFVGIVVPHLLRLATGPDHTRLLPNAAILGAALLVGADTLARLVVAPAELPIGIITAILGAPVFLWILLRQAPFAEA